MKRELVIPLLVLVLMGCAQKVEPVAPRPMTDKLSRLADATDILSPDQVRYLFSLDRYQWARNVSAGSVTGVVKAIPTDDGLIMGLRTRDGDILLVQPAYGDDAAAPKMIFINTGYLGADEPDAAETAATRLEKMRRDLAPDYDIHGEFRRTDHGGGIFMTIKPASSL